MDTSSSIDFNNKVYGSIDFFGYTVWVNDTIIGTWIVMLILITFAVIARIKISKFNDEPTGFQNFLECIVELMDKFCVGNMGQKYSYFGAWFFGVFAFILCSNLSGLVNLRPPTADLSTTAALGLSTFLMVHTFGILKNTRIYFKEYLEPFSFMLPINILGELAIPVSLSFRLFGNLLGGTIIIGLIYSLFPVALKYGIPVPLHFYFDVFAGVLQTYIFCILSMTFIKGKLPE